MKELLAGLVLFILLSSMFLSLYSDRNDNLSELPSGTVIVNVNYEDFLLSDYIQYKTSDGVIEIYRIYPIALMKSDGTFYSVGDTINHYNTNGDILYTREDGTTYLLNP